MAAGKAGQGNKHGAGSGGNGSGVRRDLAAMIDSAELGSVGARESGTDEKRGALTGI